MSMDPETMYPTIGEDVYWQRDVNKIHIFAEKTGESQVGNITAGRILELCDGTHSIKEIGTILMKEFLKSPSEENVLTFITGFLSQCEEKGFIEFRITPAEKAPHKDWQKFTRKDVEKLVQESALVVIDEKASFEPTEDGNLMTYSIRDGKYLMLTGEEKDMLITLLEEQPLQDVLANIKEQHGENAKQMVTEFVCELLNHGLAKVQSNKTEE
jgi:hypothetical protein